MTIPEHLQVLQPVVLRRHTTGSVLATARLSLLDGGAWQGLVTEDSLLTRVLYKSKNQHRASKHFKKLQQVPIVVMTPTIVPTHPPPPAASKPSTPTRTAAAPDL